ncbi:alkaline phosphatase family protein, partial [Acidianus sp. RZ1]|uniref:alkaline phosphatase family protein n=1 Tax=Acidianus sp. RZ1 TaxID=1540082 RepID=UPI0017F8A479
MKWIAIIIALLLISTLISPSIYSYSQQTLTPIKHVVIIILENHSFDNIFGTYPFGIPSVKNNVTCSLMRPVGIPENASLPINPYNTSEGYSHPYYAKSVILQDPREGYEYYHEDWNFGNMNGFITGSGYQSLAFVSYEQVPLLWDYAEEYT